MKIELTQQQAEDQQAIRAFVDHEIAPYADQWDREERLLNIAKYAYQERG